MEWLFLSLILLSSLLYTLTGFLNNFITDAYFRGRRPESQKIFDLIGYIAVIVVIVLVAPPHALPLPFLLITLLAGAVDSIGFIFYYRALGREEATGVAILTQFTPVLALVAGIFILGESISLLQGFAIALLLIAAALIIFSRGRRSLHSQLRTALLLLFAMLLWTAADTSFIISGHEFDFPTGFFYFIVGKLITDTILMAVMKSWRTRVKNVFREFRGRLLRTVIINQAICTAAAILWRIAILSVPIALASAVENTAELIATFLLGLLFTIIWPRFGREKLTRRTISYHLLALLASIAAILLIQLA